jgi:hypothetical protein
LFGETDIRDPSASSLLNVNKAAGIETKKSQVARNHGQIINPEKEKRLLFREANMGSHLPSALTRRHGIEIKSQVGRNQDLKNNPRKEIFIV